MIYPYTNHQLKQIVNEFVTRYEAACEESRMELIRRSSGGAGIPMPGHLYSSEAKNAFDDTCTTLREKAMQVIETEVNALRDSMLKAPPADVVNIITLLDLRNDVQMEEINALMDKYGDNEQAFRAIAGVSARKRLHVYHDSPKVQHLNDCIHLQNTLRDMLSTASAESGHASKGYAEMVTIQIDLVFPAE